MYKDCGSDNTDNEPDENIENAPTVNSFSFPSVKTVKNISPKYRCPTCNKIYLGQSKMNRHFTKYPDHQNEKYLRTLDDDKSKEEKKSDFSKGPTIWRKGLCWGKPPPHKSKDYIPLTELLKYYNEKEVATAAAAKVVQALSLWELLLLRLDVLHPEKEIRVPSLLQELSEFFQAVKRVASDLFKPLTTISTTTSNVHIEEGSLCSVLGLQKGYYNYNPALLETGEQSLKRRLEEIKQPSTLALNDQVASSLSEAKRIKIEENNASTPPLNRDAPSLLLNTDLLCDKSHPPLTVDQMLDEDLRSLAPVEDIISALPELPQQQRDSLELDMRADDLMANLLTSVESSIRSAPSLNHSGIFNQETQLTHSSVVSVSTEDLMKSLETLSEMTPEVEAEGSLTAGDLDFALLSGDTCG